MKYPFLIKNYFVDFSEARLQIIIFYLKYCLANDGRLVILYQARLIMSNKNKIIGMIFHFEIFHSLVI